MSNHLITLDEYQDFCGSTAVYPGKGSFLGLMYVAGKMNGEAGELAENVFKALRDDNLVEKYAVIEVNPVYAMDAVSVQFGMVDFERRMKIKKELGDVLWYVARTATELGFQLSEIVSENMEKLQSRKDRGVLQGSGDDR